MAPHSSTLAWKIPWMEEPGRLQSMGSLRVRHDWATSLSLFTFMHWRRKWQPTPVFLPGESQGQGSLVGCRLWGRTESDTTEATSQQQQQQYVQGVQRAKLPSITTYFWRLQLVTEMISMSIKEKREFGTWSNKSKARRNPGKYLWPWFYFILWLCINYTMRPPLDGGYHIIG